MRKCARPKGRADAMTVHLLTSAKKPLLDFVRQRLLPLEPCEVRTVLVPVAQETAEDVAQALGLVPGDSGFASMPGLHVVLCGGTRLVLVRAETAAAALRETTTVPDVLVSMPEDINGGFRRLMGARTRLVTMAPLERAPGFLEPDGESWRLRSARKAPEEQQEQQGGGSSASERVLIVGAGLAGAMTAWELAQRGSRAVVVDAGPVPGSGASALHAGLIHPHWQASDSPLFQLTRAGFEAMTEVLRDFPDAFIPEGVVDAASSEEEYEKWREAAAYGRPVHLPGDFASLLTREEASERAGLALSRGGWLYPKAGLVHAGRLARRMLEAAQAQVLTNMPVSLRRREGLWEAVSAQGVVVARAPKAVVCAALATPCVLGLARGTMGLSPLYGRISLLRETDLPELRCALTGDGYVARTEGFCAVGATYEPGEAPDVAVQEAHEHNLSTFDKLTGRRPDVLAAGFYEGVRAVPADRMPLAGRGWTVAELEGLAFRGVPEARSIPRAPGLWICAGFGSRGLTWGLACARHVAADVTGDVQALPGSLAAKLDPARFLPKLLAG